MRDQTRLSEELEEKAKSTHGNKTAPGKARARSKKPLAQAGIGVSWLAAGSWLG